MDWLVIKCATEENAAHFKRLENYERDFDLKKGIPLRDAFPPEATIRMDPDFPDDIELVDSLRSNGELLIINDRAAKLLAAAGVDNIELLPVKVLNHKEKGVKETYSVVNVLSIVDCIDRQQSTLKFNSIDPTSISRVRKLVLDAKRLPNDVKLFRPKDLQQTTLIQRKVADKIQADGLRGFLFEEVEDFTYP